MTSTTRISTHSTDDTTGGTVSTGSITLASLQVGAAAWGTITGVLSTQGDLQAALDGKQASLGFTAVPNTRTVAGKALSSDIALVKADVGLGNVDNTSDANKPVSTAEQTALNLKANLAGAVFTGAIGYASGVGGTVVQATNKSTGVTLNKLCGTITMNGAALAAATIVSFTVTNSTVAATDVVHIQHDTVGAIGGYTVMPNTSAAGSFRVSVRDNTAGSLSEAIVLRFAVVKAVTA